MGKKRMNKKVLWSIIFIQILIIGIGSFILVPKVIDRLDNNDSSNNTEKEETLCFIFISIKGQKKRRIPRHRPGDPFSSFYG